MPATSLLDPPALREKLATRFRRQRSDWLLGGGSWPLQLPLGVPSENTAMEQGTAVRDWVDVWAAWQGPGEVLWTDRRWRRLGTQRLPESIRFDNAEQVCAVIGDAEIWRQACNRLDTITSRWPQLAGASARNWPLLAEWPEADFLALMRLTAWLLENPDSGLYPRQLPVPGVDGKWLERHRRVLQNWLALLRSVPADTGDIHTLAGLRSLPIRLRFRVLDPELCRNFGGLSDITAPVAEIAALELSLRCVFIVENLQTGLAFESLAGTLVFMQQGYAVEPFGELSWLQDVPVYYWGDIDTNGFAILDRLRRYLPHARSLLMDEATLLAHRDLWGHEAKPAAAGELPRLTPEEQAVQHGLRQGQWGPGVRLEQERIGWGYAWKQVSRAWRESA